MSRRSLLKTAAVTPLLRASGPAVVTPWPADVRVRDVRFDYQEFIYRAPYKFGGKVVDRATIINVHTVVEKRNGRTAQGFGSMPQGNIWAFPSKSHAYNETLEAMQQLAGRIQTILSGHSEYGHPFDFEKALEPQYLQAALEVASNLKLREPIPKLCTLVTASAFDAALHDAYGKVHGVNCYSTYGRDFVRHDLAHYLGPDFKGEFVDQYIQRQPRSEIALFHSVGAADPITTADLERPVGDGLPETLSDWIDFNGLTHFKIKLNGDNLQWDVERVLRIDAVVQEAGRRRGFGGWEYLLDFNENCPNVQYLLDFLQQIQERIPESFERIQYIEQPTSRDLKANRSNVMHEASRRCPVVIDESLTDLETLLLARQMGYTGVALKACKGQSHAMLMTAAARKYNMFLTVQDLTCPGASLVHSAGIAAHVPEVRAIEANSRQYMPSANDPWKDKFPGIFVIQNGKLRTAAITGPGLGVIPPSGGGS